MGGLSAAAAAGAAGSAGASGTASGLMGTAAALGASKMASSGKEGFSYSSILGPMGVGLDIKGILDSKGSSKRQEKNALLLQYANLQRKKNILEQQLATRRTRMASMGISSSASADAANDKLIDDVFDDVAQDNLAFLSQEEGYNNTQNQYRKNLLDIGLSSAGKLLK